MMPELFVQDWPLTDLTGRALLPKLFEWCCEYGCERCKFTGIIPTEMGYQIIEFMRLAGRDATERWRR